jgi:hypothetical protein
VGACSEDQVLLGVRLGPELVRVAEHQRVPVGRGPVEAYAVSSRDGAPADLCFPRRTAPVGDERVIDAQDLLDGRLDRGVLPAAT